MKDFNQIPSERMAAPFGSGSLESKNPEEAKREKIQEETEFSKNLPGRKEETGYYSALRRELREMQRGGADLHFGQIDADRLSPDALELYRKYNKEKLTEEDAKEFMSNISAGSDDYNFGAMLLNWLIGKKSNKKEYRK